MNQLPSQQTWTSEALQYNKSSTRWKMINMQWKVTWWLKMEILLMMDWIRRMKARMMEVWQEERRVVNEMPDIVNNYISCNEPQHNTSLQMFSNNCIKCGSLNCYADDANYVYYSSNRVNKQQVISNKWITIKNFLEANHLTINTTKTVLQESIMYHKETKIGGAPITLDTWDPITEVTKTITSNRYHRALGLTVQESTSWKSHMEEGEDALLPCLRSKLDMLKYIGRNLPQPSKKLLATGTILSKLQYMIPILGGLEEKY